MVRLLGFADSAYALIGTFARVIILAVLNLKRVSRFFVVKKHPSLKTLASEIAFGLCNKPKSCFDNVTTCTPLVILEIPEDALLHMIFLNHINTMSHSFYLRTAIVTKGTFPYKY